MADFDFSKVKVMHRFLYQNTGTTSSQTASFEILHMKIGSVCLGCTRVKERRKFKEKRKKSTHPYICSLDISKAFDRINHYRLYTKLMERLLPLNIVMLLLNLYKSSSAVVSWNGFLSKPYHVFAGVRQGGSISPVLFSVYVNSVIEILSKCSLGCSIGLTYLGVIMYADDLLLISGSVSNLQKMIDKCLK